MSILSHRDAFADFADVASDLTLTTAPVPSDLKLSIVVPTYRRPELLMKTIRSALDQKTTVPYEIVVIDNDPDGAGFAAVRDQLAKLQAVPLRYFVNARNIGMFGNWNRGIELAAAPWVTILNDDDLLMPGFVDGIFSTLAKRPEIDGIVARKLEYRHHTGEVKPDPTNWRFRLKDRINRLRFDKDRLRQVLPKHLFFGNELHNSLGFVFRRDAVISIGGYKPEEFPAADYFFYIRFCRAYRLFWYFRVLAYIGIGENESMKPDTLMQYMYQGAEVRDALAGTEVPRDWFKLHPLMTSLTIKHMESVWGYTFDRAEVERRLHISLPPPRSFKIRWARLVRLSY